MHEDCANSASIALTLAAKVKEPLRFVAPDLVYKESFAGAFERVHIADLGGGSTEKPGGW
jgi:hypothetical protein